MSAACSSRSRWLVRARGGGIARRSTRRARLRADAPAAPAGGRGGPPRSPREAAPVDLTGYWVSVVTEDWRWRMVTPARGDFAGVPLNAGGAQARAGVGSGEGRGRGRAVPGLRRGGHHAGARTAAHHLARRHHAEDRDRRRHADAAASTSAAQPAPGAQPSWQGYSAAALGGDRCAARASPTSCRLRSTRARACAAARSRSSPRTCGRGTCGRTACPTARARRCKEYLRRPDRAQRRHLVRGDDHRRGSRVPDHAVRHEHELQEAGRRHRLEPTSLLGSRDARSPASQGEVEAGRQAAVRGGQVFRPAVVQRLHHHRISPAAGRSRAWPARRRQWSSSAPHVTRVVRRQQRRERQAAAQLAGHGGRRIDHGHARSRHVADHRLEKRVVGAAEHDGVGARGHERPHVLFDQRPRRRRVEIAVLHLFDQTGAGLHLGAARRRILADQPQQVRARPA